MQYSHNDPATAANLVSAALQKDPDIVGIFATNLFSAEGSATGVRQAGPRTMTIVGFDAGPNQIKALKDGTVQALVAQQPSNIGSDGIEQADAALTGKTVTPKIQTGFTIITKDNRPARVARRRTSRPADPVTPPTAGPPCAQGRGGPASMPGCRPMRRNLHLRTTTEVARR